MMSAVPIKMVLCAGAQWAGKNLDSSEKFVLGGASGVRAWPSGEATGDEGWLAQAELRYQAGWAQPYVFMDAGTVRINKNPWTSAANRRHIAGAGFGLRADNGPWHLDTALAWRTSGGQPTTEPNASRPTVWVSVSYRF